MSAHCGRGPAVVSQEKVSPTANITGTINSIAGFNNDLIRKPLTGVVLLSRWPSRTAITTLVGTAGQIIVPDDYKSTGRVSEDGLSKTIDEDYSEIRGWGASSFVRRDTQSRNLSSQFAAIESRKLTKELHIGLDMPSTVSTAAPEVKVDHPDRPDTKYWSMLAIGTDGSGSSAFHMATWYPKCSVTDRDDEGWSDGDDPVMYNVTLSAVLDDALGITASDFWFGPGLLSRAAAMGFTVTA